VLSWAGAGLLTRGQAGQARGPRPRIASAAITGVLQVLQRRPVRLILRRERGQFLGQDLLLVIPARAGEWCGPAARGDRALGASWHLLTSRVAGVNLLEHTIV
jgi:hypothetical protein